MKTIEPSFEIYYPEVNKEAEMIEKAGRTCYKSEDKITDGSAAKFVEGLIKREHEAMLEHAHLIYRIGDGEYQFFKKACEFIFLNNKQVYLVLTKDVVSGNVRAWRDFFKNTKDLFVPTECDCSSLVGAYIRYPIPKTICTEILEKERVFFNDIYPEGCKYIAFGGDFIKKIGLDDLTPEELMIHGYLTVKFIVDRGVSHELVRHRPASFAQESSRYCDYSNGKYGGELTFIEPSFFQSDLRKHSLWYSQMAMAETSYLSLRDLGASPEEARTVLPNSLKTEVIMTAYFSEWRHFFLLRAARQTGKAHPQMEEVTVPLLREFSKNYPLVFGDIWEKAKEVHGIDEEKIR